MSKTQPLAVGDTARIIQNKKPLTLGETLWEIVELGTSFDTCLIKEANTNYAPQAYFLSMLQKVTK